MTTNTATVLAIGPDEPGAGHALTVDVPGHADPRTIHLSNLPANLAVGATIPWSEPGHD